MGFCFGGLISLVLEATGPGALALEPRSHRTLDPPDTTQRAKGDALSSFVHAFRVLSPMLLGQSVGHDATHRYNIRTV